MIMNKEKSKMLIEAITESNYIEKEYSVKGLRQSIQAFEYLDGCQYDEEQIYKKIRVNDIRIAHGYMMDGLMPLGHKAGSFRECSVYVGKRLQENVGALAIRLQVIDWLHDFPKLMEVMKTRKEKLTMIKELHKRFEFIHPFRDGNGRMGRLLMNIQAIRYGLEPIIILEKAKEDYYKWFYQEPR